MGPTRSRYLPDFDRPNSKTEHANRVETTLKPSDQAVTPAARWTFPSIYSRTKAGALPARTMATSARWLDLFADARGSGATPPADRILRLNSDHRKLLHTEQSEQRLARS